MLDELSVEREIGTSGLLAAGGNLAAAVCILARDKGPKLAQQLLYYPCVGASVDQPGDKSEYASMAEFGPGSEGLLNSEDAARLMALCALSTAVTAASRQLRCQAQRCTHGLHAGMPHVGRMLRAGTSRSQQMSAFLSCART